MAKFAVQKRTNAGFTSVSPSDYYKQLESHASVNVLKKGAATYPWARMTSRAQQRKKLTTCGKDALCQFADERVRIEVSALAQDTLEGRQQTIKLLMIAADDMQKQLKQGVVIGTPREPDTDDTISSLALNLTGAAGVGA